MRDQSRLCSAGDSVGLFLSFAIKSLLWGNPDNIDLEHSPDVILREHVDSINMH